MYTSSRDINVVAGNSLTSSLSVTSNDVINNYNRLLEQIKNPAVLSALKVVETQQQTSEKNLISTTSVCGLPVLSSLRDHLGGLKADVLKDYTTTQLHNPSAMMATMCVVDSVFYTSAYDVGSLYLNNRIRMYIHNLRQIGNESSEGYSLVSDFENTKDLFVIKVARSPADDTLLHELIVGIYGTNKLRQHIPNFAYVYGGFQCSPPLVDPDTKTVVTWCLHDSNSVNYVLYENINPSISLENYLKTCSGKDFLIVYMQILYSLRLGLKVIDFTHYDLHFENILIRNPKEFTSNFQIAYETERGVEYLTTNSIATIIDYGYAHFKTGDISNNSGNLIAKGQHYGRNELVQFSIYSYRSWIMHDLYKLLMFCLMGASRNNNQGVFLEAIKIFRFFNHTEDPLVAVNAQSSIKFSFPLTESTNTLSINDLAVYIRSVCNCDFLNAQQTSNPILDCEKICLTEDAILAGIGMNPNGPLGTPGDIFEAYDILTRLQNEGREAEKKKMADDFEYTKCMKTHIDKMKSLYSDLVTVRSKLKLIDIGNMTVNEVLNYKIMTIVRSMYVSVGEIIDKTVELRYYHKIGLAMAHTYQDDLAITIINEIMKQFDMEVRPSLEDSKRVLGINDEYLNRIETDAITEEALRRDERLAWYFAGRRLFDIVFGRIDASVD